MARLPTADLRIRTVRSLVSPAVLAGELPLDDAGADSVAQSRRAVEDILAGRDDRLLDLGGALFHP